MNSESLSEKIRSDDNLLGPLLARGSGDGDIVRPIFELAYARPPTDREAALVIAHLEAEESAGRSKRKALEGVLWSVINSKEFQLNH